MIQIYPTNKLIQIIEINEKNLFENRFKYVKINNNNNLNKYCIF